MSRRLVSHTDAGRACPFCHFPLKSGAVAFECDSCATLHHEDCWADGGGCSILGCDQSAAARGQGESQSVAPKRAAAPPQWPSNSPPVVTPMADAEFTESPGSQSAVILALVGVLAVAIIAVVGIVVVNALNDDPVALSPSADASSASERDSEDFTETDAMVARKVVSVLRRYASAYSNEDRNGLSEIFAPSIQRWGVHGSATCQHDYGKLAVLDAYQSQFDVNSPVDYKLTPLNSSIVDRISETRARVNTNYSINGSGEPMTFSLVRSDSAGWRITRAKVDSCA